MNAPALLWLLLLPTGCYAILHGLLSWLFYYFLSFPLDITRSTPSNSDLDSDPSDDYTLNDQDSIPLDCFPSSLRRRATQWRHGYRRIFYPRRLRSFFLRLPLRLHSQSAALPRFAYIYSSGYQDRAQWIYRVCSLVHVLVASSGCLWFVSTHPCWFPQDDSPRARFNFLPPPGVRLTDHADANWIWLHSMGYLLYTLGACFVYPPLLPFSVSVHHLIMVVGLGMELKTQYYPYAVALLLLLSEFMTTPLLHLRWALKKLHFHPLTLMFIWVNRLLLLSFAVGRLLTFFVVFAMHWMYLHALNFATYPQLAMADPPGPLDYHLRYPDDFFSAERTLASILKGAVNSTTTFSLTKGAVWPKLGWIEQYGFTVILLLLSMLNIMWFVQLCQSYGKAGARKGASYGRASGETEQIDQVGIPLLEFRMQPVHRLA